MTRQELFWSRVWQDRRKLTAELKEGKLHGQPTWTERSFAENLDFPNKSFDGNSIYLTSEQNYDKGTKGGVVVMSTVHLAGQRVAESTHRPSTKAEIEAYQQEQADRLEVEKRRQHITAAGAAAAAMEKAQLEYASVAAITNQVRPQPGKPAEAKT